LAQAKSRYNPSFSDLSIIAPEFFACDKTLRKMERLRRRAPKDHAVFHFSSLEACAPSWVGQGLTKQERKSLAAARSFERPNASMIINNIVNLLFSHVAIGEMCLGSAAQHVAIISRLMQEKTIAWVTRYIALSYSRIQSLCAAGKIAVGKLEREFENVDQEVARQVDLEVLRRADRPAPRAAAAAQLPRSRAVAQRATPTGKGRGGRPPRRLSPSRTAPVCFAHNPAAGAQCKVAGCSKVHLDTHDVDGKARFAAAKSAFDRRQAALKQSGPGKSAPAQS